MWALATVSSAGFIRFSASWSSSVISASGLHYSLTSWTFSRILILDGLWACFTGTDANGFINRQDKDFPIANLSGFSGLLHRLNDFLDVKTETSILKMTEISSLNVVSVLHSDRLPSPSR